MNILEFQSVGGASGDMILAALIDLGVSRDELQKRLESLDIGSFAVEAVAGVFSGLHGVQVRVRIGDAVPPAPLNHRHDAAALSVEMPAVRGHNHSGAHRHDREHAHGHAHERGPAHGHAGAHAPHRGLAEIRRIIAAADLPPAARDMSLNVFENLARAEARVHGVTPDEIHFHEVGAVDSIVDIVGACLARDMLGVEDVAVGPLPLGCGTIQCAHGLLPSPAPATVELLRGVPTISTDEPFELVTPTGAALLTAWRTLERPPDGRIQQAGYGFGHARLHGRPNLLRALLRDGSGAAGADITAEECLELACNLDDASPELVGALAGRIMAQGALDVFVTPVQMKKQRPGILLTVLCRPEQRPEILETIFLESTTFGVRAHRVQRTLLARRNAQVLTPYGPVRIKIGAWRGRDIKASPEYEDCRALAESRHVPLPAVYAAALGAAGGFLQPAVSRNPPVKTPVTPAGV